MPEALRIGLVGTGRIGRVHAANVAASKDTELTWAADPFIAGAQEIAGVYGAKATADPAELIAAADVDAVIVASPTSTHVDLISACLDAGKPVLCEKPIDLDMARVDAIRSRVRASAVPVILGFNRRFDSQFAEVRARVAAGEVGNLEQLVIISRDPAPPTASYVATSGGIFHDMTIHDLDMARFMLGDIVEVSATGTIAFSDEIAEAGDYDSAVVTLKSSTGALATIVNSRHSAFGYDQRLEAFGSLGMLQAANVSPSLVSRSTATQVEVRAPYLDFFLERYADAYRAELTAFVSAARGDESTSPDFEDGRAALVLADAAKLSASTGQAVALARD